MRYDPKNPIAGRCIESVFDNSGWHSYQCSRKIWKDQHCKRHHPETVKAAREARQAKWERKWKAESEARNAPAKRIAELEAEVAQLKETIKRMEQPK